MPIHVDQSQFVICISNDEYPASLELRKVYRQLPDEATTSRGFMRFVDESGEDYLYPRACFVPITVPKPAIAVFG